MAKPDVKRQYPRAKCIHSGGIYMIVKWDAFFSVGPLLGQGYTPEEAWDSVYIPPQITSQVVSAVMNGDMFFRGHRSKLKGRKR